MTKLESANAVIDNIRSKTNEIGVFLSFGKDSLVILDMVYPKFDKVVCFYMYFLKNLEHMNRWINWAQARYPKIEIVQIPHWTLSYLLRSGLYCTPNPNVKLISLQDVVQSMRLKYNIEYMFLGMKMADGMNRRLMLKTYESNLYENKGMVYPLAEWTQKEILAYMKQHGLPEPVRYTIKKASSGIGFNVECLAWLEEHYPEDLLKIYEAYPISRRILFEYHYHEKMEQEQLNNNEDEKVSN